MTRSALVVAGILAALLFAEISARFLPLPDVRRTGDGAEPRGELWVDAEWRLPPPRAFRLDPVLMVDHERYFQTFVPVAEHAGKQFKFATNGYGLRRDGEISIEKPPGVFRILVLGDSQTDGLVDNQETYSARLEARLHARNVNAEVLNAGVTGYSPQQSYLWYRERGAQLRPDVVILGLYVGNDLLDLIESKLDARVIDDDLGLLNPLYQPLDWISIHSRLARMASYTMRDSGLAPILEALGYHRPPPVELDRVLRVLKDCHGCWLQSGKQAVVAGQRPEETRAAFGRLRTLIAGLDARVAANGGQLILLPIPTKNQVEPSDDRGNVTKMQRILEMDERGLTFDDRVFSAVAEVANEKRIPLVDAREDLATSGRGERGYYRRDWHLNPRGNSVVAESLDRYLAAHGTLVMRSAAAQ
ncbi:MAG: GDSL-type esterase/lipase family protein [Chloroflexota bacterium]